MSGQGNEPVDEDGFDLVNPVFENANSAGSSNGGGTARARGSGVAGVLAGVENGRQQQEQQQQQHAAVPQQQIQQRQRRPRKSSKGKSASTGAAQYDYMKVLTEPKAIVPHKREKPAMCVMPPKATSSGANPILKGPVTGKRSAAEKNKAHEDIIVNYKNHIENTQPKIEEHYKTMNKNVNDLYADNEKLYDTISIKDAYIKSQAEHNAALQAEIIRLQSEVSQKQSYLKSQQQAHLSIMSTKDSMIALLRDEIKTKNNSLAIQEAGELVTHRTNESIRGAAEKAENDANIKDDKAKRKTKAQQTRMKEVKRNQRNNATNGNWRLENLGNFDDDSHGSSHRKERSKRSGRDGSRRRRSRSWSSSGSSRSRSWSSRRSRSHSRRRRSSSYSHRNSDGGGRRRRSGEGGKRRRDEGGSRSRGGSDSRRNDRRRSESHDDSTIDTFDLPEEGVERRSPVRSVVAPAVQNNQQLNNPRLVFQEDETNDILRELAH